MRDGFPPAVLIFSQSIPVHTLQIRTLQHTWNKFVRKNIKKVSVSDVKLGGAAARPDVISSHEEQAYTGHGLTRSVIGPRRRRK